MWSGIRKFVLGEWGTRRRKFFHGLSRRFVAIPFNQIEVPTFEMTSNPTIQLSEVKARRFYIIDRAQINAKEKLGSGFREDPLGNSDLREYKRNTIVFERIGSEVEHRARTVITNTNPDGLLREGEYGITISRLHDIDDTDEENNEEEKVRC